MGSYQVLPLQAKVDLGATIMNAYSAFPKVPASPSDCLVSYPGHSLGRSVEVQSVYSTPPDDWATFQIEPNTETTQLQENNICCNEEFKRTKFI